MPNRHTVVTSWGPDGWDLYGRRFLESFMAHWPLERVKLLVYHEGVGIPDDVRARSFDLLSVSDGCKAFLDRHRNDMVAQGRKRAEGHFWKEKAVRDGYNFRYDAYKFCRKVFAMEHAVETVERGRLFWIDADVRTFTDVPPSMLDRMLPDGFDTCHLYRGEHYHSECGFVGYNLDRRGARRLMRRFVELYHKDTVFLLKEWHDSWVYDWVARRVGARSYRIPAPRNHHHQFINSELGRYMDHMKGDVRKTRERSMDGEMVVGHDHEYWRRR